MMAILEKRKSTADGRTGAVDRVCNCLLCPRKASTTSPSSPPTAGCSSCTSPSHLSGALYWLGLAKNPNAHPNLAHSRDQDFKDIGFHRQREVVRHFGRLHIHPTVRYRPRTSFLCLHLTYITYRRCPTLRVFLRCTSSTVTRRYRQPSELPPPVSRPALDQANSSKRPSTAFTKKRIRSTR